MQEVRIFMELIKHNDGTIGITNGGGICNDGQMESFDNIAAAIKDLNERVAVEYNRLNQKYYANE